MGKLKYLLRDKVKTTEGKRFYVLTVDLYNHFGIEHWGVVEGRMKYFQSFIRPTKYFWNRFGRGHAAVCIENDSEEDARRAHDKLCILLKEGNVMGPGWSEIDQKSDEALIKPYTKAVDIQFPT